MTDTDLELARAISKGIYAAIGSHLIRSSHLPESRTLEFHHDGDGNFSFSESSGIDWARAVQQGLDGSDDVAVTQALASLDGLLHPAWQPGSSVNSRERIVEGLLALAAGVSLAGAVQAPRTSDELLRPLLDALPRLRRFCSAETFVAGYAMPLVGLSCDEPLIQLDDNVRLRAVDDAGRHEIWRRISNPIARGHEALAEVHDVAAVGAQLEMVAQFPAGGQLDMRVVQHRWNDGLEAIRMSTPGPVYSPWQFPVADDHEPYVGLVVMGGIGRHARLFGQAPDIHSVDGSLANAWRRLTVIDAELSGKDSARFEGARKRFGDAYDRRSPEDR